MSNDPNQTKIVTEGFNPQAISLDNARLNVQSETQFDFQNALAIPSRGILADSVTWVSFSALAFRIPFQLYLWYAPIQVVLGYLLIMAIFGFILGGLILSQKNALTIFYRVAMVAIGFCIAIQFGHYGQA